MFRRTSLGYHVHGIRFSSLVRGWREGTELRACHTYHLFLLPLLDRSLSLLCISYSFSLSRRASRSPSHRVMTCWLSDRARRGSTIRATKRSRRCEERRNGGQEAGGWSDKKGTNNRDKHDDYFEPGRAQNKKKSFRNFGELTVILKSKLLRVEI